MTNNKKQRTYEKRHKYERGRKKGLNPTNTNGAN